MKNGIKNYLHPQYKYRLDTDLIFEKIQKTMQFSGIFGNALDFVTNHQCLNEELWTTFVEQFRIQDDAPEQRWKGEYWGKMMRGACFVYKCTQNTQLFKVLKKSVEDLLTTQDDLGRITTYELDNELIGWDLWGRKYVMLGLLYFLEISNDKEFNKVILNALVKHADYIVDHIGEGKKDIFDTAYCWGGLQSSSILEPFVKLYAITDDKKYLDFSEYIVKKGGCSFGNMIEAALNEKILPYQYPVNKAYEAMSFYEGVAEYYSVTKEEKYKKAFLNFVDKVLESDFTVIGASGCTEEQFDNSSVRQTEYHFEVMLETCVTVTLLKVLSRAFELTRNVKYLDSMEISYYNGMLNATNFSCNDELYWGKEFELQFDYSPAKEWIKKIKGFTFDSYAPIYKSSRNRKTGGFNFLQGYKGYGCCACIGALGISMLPLYSFMNTDDGIAINFFNSMSGEVLSPKGQIVEISVETKYPFGKKVYVKVGCKEAEKFKIYIRIPNFIKSAKIDKNFVNPGQFYALEKTWNHNSIEIEFDYDIVAKQINNKIYVSEGPIVYAIDDRNENIDKKATQNILDVKIIEVPFRHNKAIEVLFDNEESIKLVDYASCGSDWNRAGNKVTVFIDE